MHMTILSHPTRYCMASVLYNDCNKTGGILYIHYQVSPSHLNLVHLVKAHNMQASIPKRSSMPAACMMVVLKRWLSLQLV